MSRSPRVINHIEEAGKEDNEGKRRVETVRN